MQEERRQARLRQEYATLYPGVPAGEWRPVGELLDCIASTRLQSGRHSGELLRGRVLDDGHFEFRGGDDRPDAAARSRTRATDPQEPPR